MATLMSGPALPVVLPPIKSGPRMAGKRADAQPARSALVLLRVQTPARFGLEVPHVAGSRSRAGHPHSNGVPGDAPAATDAGPDIAVVRRGRGGVRTRRQAPDSGRLSALGPRWQVDAGRSLDKSVALWSPADISVGQAQSDRRGSRCR